MNMRCAVRSLLMWSQVASKQNQREAQVYIFNINMNTPQCFLYLLVIVLSVVWTKKQTLQGNSHVNEPCVVFVLCKCTEHS